MSSLVKTLSTYGILLATCWGALGAHAEMSLPIIPMEIFCSTMPPMQKPIYQTANFLSLTNRQQSDRIRAAIFEKLLSDYVQPAMTNGCTTAKARHGLAYYNMVHEECSRGCDVVVDEWPLKGKDRAHQMELCLSDCDGIKKTLEYIAFGVALGRKKSFFNGQ